jgi:hypothetical protein
MYCKFYFVANVTKMFTLKGVQTIHRSRYSVFQKELYNGIANVTVWRVLLKCLHLKAYKPPIVQGVIKHF